MIEQTFVMVRHGQTDFNVLGQIQDTLQPQLTDVGRIQAQTLKHELERLLLKFDVIVCADATRTIDTLRVLYPEFETMPIVKIDTRLQERFHEDLIGKTKDDIQKELGKSLPGRLSWHLYFEGTGLSDLLPDRYPNDESLDSVRNRLTSLMSDVSEHSTVLLLGSSVVNQYILEFLQYGTIGLHKFQYPEGNEIDFQKNNEVRILTIADNHDVKTYESIIFPFD